MASTLEREKSSISTIFLSKFSMHLAGMIKKFLLTFLPLLHVLAGWGQSALYAPLLGHVDMRTAYILVTSEKAEEVVLRYFPTAQPDQTTTLKGMTSDDLDHSYKFVLMPLEPGTSYGYQLGAANAPLGPIHTFTTSELWPVVVLTSTKRLTIARENRMAPTMRSLIPCLPKNRT
jgi:hypothetical protein